MTRDPLRAETGAVQAAFTSWDEKHGPVHGVDRAYACVPAKCSSTARWEHPSVGWWPWEPCLRRPRSGLWGSGGSAFVARSLTWSPPFATDHLSIFSRRLLYG